MLFFLKETNAKESETSSKLINVLIALSTQQTEVNKKLYQKWRIFGKGRLEEQQKVLDALVENTKELICKERSTRVSVKKNFEVNKDSDSNIYVIV